MPSARIGFGCSDVESVAAQLEKARRASWPSLPRTILKDQPDYRFAAEIAARFLERKNEISLDQIICDPPLAEQFDEIARAIAPGGRPLEYRWAALNLRKQRRLRPEVLARVVRPVEVLRVNADGVLLELVPRSPGLYIFYSNQATLYVGESDNLQKRIRKHLDHSDRKELRDGSGNSVTPRFIWSFKSWTGRSRSEFEGLSSSSSFGLARRSST